MQQGKSHYVIAISHRLCNWSHIDSWSVVQSAQCAPPQLSIEHKRQVELLVWPVASKLSALCTNISNLFPSPTQLKTWFDRTAWWQDNACLNPVSQVAGITRRILIALATSISK